MKKISSLAAVFILTGTSYLNAADWPIWRGPNNDGISLEKVNLKSLSSPQVMWQKELGYGYSSVSVKGDRLYTMGYNDGQDTIYCLNPKTGKEIWTYSYEEEKGGGYKGPRATPIIDGDLLYTQSCTGKLHCLDVKSGKVQWEANFADFGGQDIKWHYAGSAVIYKDFVIYNTNKYGLALNKKTGKKVWASPGGKCNYATPYLFSINGKDAVAIFAEKSMIAVDPKNGKKLWSFDWETKYNINGADPIVSGNQMFISSAYGNGGAMLKFTSSSVSTLWKNTDMQNHFDSSVLIDGHLYGINGRTGNKKSTVTCMDWKTGKVRWAEKIGGYGALSAVGKNLVFLVENGTLIVAEASPSGYTEIARKEKLISKKCWIAPVLVNGILYCKSNEGRLMAIDVAK